MYLQLILALSCLGLNSLDEPVRIQDMISLLWKEARVNDELTLEVEKAQIHNQNDLIELGLLKLTLFGVSLNQPFTKYCLPCRNPKPMYSQTSWTTMSNMKRTSGELVRHEADKCPICQNVLEHCSHSVFV
jgi:hypothetical protein